MAQKEMQRMMQGAVVLTVASFIAKVLSAFYRVPFQNFVGMKDFTCISKFIQSMGLR